MIVNRDKPDRWKEDIAKSVDMYNEWFMRFAPKANNYELRSSDEELRILIATDVLSEGLNMQDANHVINYDLHWNPVRLIQRVGRVDRIGTEHATIYAYNFLPETGLERELGIEEGQTTEDMRFTFETVACLGTCFLAPVVMIDNDYFGNVSASRIKTIIRRYE